MGAGGVCAHRCHWYLHLELYLPWLQDCKWLLCCAGGAYIAMSHGILWLSFPTQAEGKAVLITGCDKGFGHALAKCLHAKGFTVFAGCLFMVSSEIDNFFFWLEKNASQVKASSFAASIYPGSRPERGGVGRDRYIFHCFICLLYLVPHSCNCELFRAGIVCQLHVCTVACTVWHCSLLEASQKYHNTINMIAQDCCGTVAFCLPQHPCGCLSQCQFFWTPSTNSSPSCLSCIIKALFPKCLATVLLQLLYKLFSLWIAE